MYILTVRSIGAIDCFCQFVEWLPNTLPNIEYGEDACIENINKKTNCYLPILKPKRDLGHSNLIYCSTSKTR